jgi:hypothetical protein
LSAEFWAHGSAAQAVTIMVGRYALNAAHRSMLSMLGLSAMKNGGFAVTAWMNANRSVRLASEESVGSSATLQGE